MFEKIPERFAKARLDDLPPDVAALIRAWVDTKEILLIVGPTGGGKSWAAAAAARAWAKAGKDRLAESIESEAERDYQFRQYRPSIRWENAPELAAEMRDIETTADAHERATKCNLLILDDLGAEKDGDWIAERIYAAIGHRYNWLKPTVVTTNVAPEEMLERWPRLASRLLSGTAIRLAGVDRRLALVR